ncbi:DEAD-box ATP-dependent RNA helicase CshA [Candidatus Kuenenia stuttgartiensis]|jgi:ATP-dependent RNA helicase DeaD|uniref:DEAD-box ATP-dependent RNA helicase RhpA n=2 Tax=Kuenenia stuttgartiensis TaxID=174633 RepID=Q1Q7A6_KUEST|nr:MULTISPECIES: DEAD/DEAH box helicase [Kuenenia]MBE7549058.1 DEAD/DEAH box helicase [Planctomycetia bacterium]MBW7941482.1 DEAD/DEAH box helicase [Candidatus Kuenenia stuttgartiensis]MBZ0190709.1 DEAD/DEAH box helicase [Candidatus Kuenenia stuttgartiensis]MCF6151537.1 DEAD/DEAH box helicase [Candidatus Kuenenia stuttgartiensis]MCL4726959.1 DEAD/DEAH box helicase [Candidatus Kuenenia stuttgartiensis]
MESFESLGLSESTLKVLKEKGYEEPTPIQQKTIPAILSGTKDIVGQAQTGTGKTAAFGLPVLELLPEKSKNVQALVLTPTRELAIQVAEELNSLKGKKRLSIVPIYGRQSMELQLRSLKKGIDIVVGTPGRVLDHLKRGTLKIGKISFLVLDEADEMLNMGFIDDVREIMENTGHEKRTLLFSATMPFEIMQIAKNYMRDFDVQKVNAGQLTVSQTDQIYFEVFAADKFEALCRIIDIEKDFYGLVFCRTKIDVDAVASHLIERGYDADALHGDISQSLREKILAKFKKRQINILIATDVAARGLDIHNLSHVINYSLPQDPESYVHRIGRTGRAGKGGIAITFITPEEYRKLQFIQKAAKTDIRKEKLPKIEDIIRTKKLKIKDHINEIVDLNAHNCYIEMAKELTEHKKPEDIISALLQYSFPDELNEKRYVEIEEAVVDKKGKTRLFVTQGKQEGLTHKKLVTYIKDISNIASEKIRDVQILDKYSFVTLPFREAEILLTSFKRRKKGSGLFITKAKKMRT